MLFIKKNIVVKKNAWIKTLDVFKIYIYVFFLFGSNYILIFFIAFSFYSKDHDANKNAVLLSKKIIGKENYEKYFSLL